MNNAQAYFKLIDLSEQKSISSKKLKELFTSTIKLKLALMQEASSIAVIDLYHEEAHTLLIFAHTYLGLYSIDEYNYIYDKIANSTSKRIKELNND